MRYSDLHLHSHFSDGTYRPAELAAQARRCELAAISLTDHDSVEGCAGTAEACETEGIEFIAGTELTAEEGKDEVHLLGYFVDTHNAKLLTQIATFQKVRQNRIREMVARLNQLRVPLKAEAVFALADCRSPGRPHVARALVEARLCGTVDEAFDRFLKRNRPAWVPKFKMGGREAIELIHQAGGVAVLAHPGLNRSDAVIPVLAEAGMDGIECYHTKHSPSMVAYYLEMAGKLHLLVTGGSDCHGLSKGKPLIGTVRVPYQYVEALQERAAEIASTAVPHAAA